MAPYLIPRNVHVIAAGCVEQAGINRDYTELVATFGIQAMMRLKF